MSDQIMSEAERHAALAEEWQNRCHELSRESSATIKALREKLQEAELERDRYRALLDTLADHLRAEA